MAVDPEYDAAYYNRGNACAALERYDRAVRDCDATLRLVLADAAALAARDEAYHQVTDEVRAIEEFDAAIDVEIRDRLLAPRSVGRSFWATL